MNELALELIIPREGTEAKWMLRKECIMSSFFGMPPALDNLIYDKFVQDQEDFMILSVINVGLAWLSA